MGYSLADINRPRNDYNIIGFLHEVLTTPKPYQNVDSSTIVRCKDKNSIRSFTGGVQINYTPIKKLELSFKGGVDNNNYRDDHTIPTNNFFNGLKGIDNQKTGNILTILMADIPII